MTFEMHDSKKRSINVVAACIVIHFLAEDDMKNSSQIANKMDIKDLKLVILCKLCDTTG